MAATDSLAAVTVIRTETAVMVAPRTVMEVEHHMEEALAALVVTKCRTWEPV